MSTPHLVRMANQIEAFFRSGSDRDVAIAGIETHLRRFWDPRMRKEVVAHYDRGGQDLGELAKAAVQRLKA